MKKILAMALVLCMMFAMCATASAADAKIKVGMVTDVGGVPRKQQKPYKNQFYIKELNYLLDLVTKSILDEVSVKRNDR